MTDPAATTEANEASKVEQDFLTIGRDVVARELVPIRKLAENSIGGEMHVVAGAVESAMHGLLTHIMAALHPSGIDAAVTASADAAAAIAPTIAQELPVPAEADPENPQPPVAEPSSPAQS